MKKDEYWSIDRLLPRITSNDPFRRVPKSGVPIAILSEPGDLDRFKHIVPTQESRVIRSIKLTDEFLPKQSDLFSDSFETVSLSFVPCQAYLPSFSKLTPLQQKYFFFFLDRIENGVKIRLAFPYLCLYLCRLIPIIASQQTIPEQFFWVWKNYRQDFPLCDKLFAEFLFDVCVYARITPPWDALEEIILQQDWHIRPFIVNLYLFDYLFRDGFTPNAAQIDFVLRQLTGMSFRNCKAYRVNQNFASACEEAIFDSFRSGLFNRKDLNEVLFRIPIPSFVTTKRKLFSGLPIDDIPRLEICMESYPYLNDETIRDRFDELIRYLENRIRAILKIKNSLSRIHISDEHKKFLEGILIRYSHLAPQSENTQQTIAINEKSASLPPRKIEVSLEDANAIERDSWELTRTLTEIYTHQNEDFIAFDPKDQSFDQKYESELNGIDKRPPLSENEFWELASAVTEEEERLIRLCLYFGKDRAREYALSIGNFFEAMLASCNQKAADTVEDAIFDPSGELYSDYLLQLKEVFPEITDDKENDDEPKR